MTSVIYNGNGSTGGITPVDPNNYTNGQLATILANTLTNTYYVFAGWNTSSNGSGTTYQPSTTLLIGVTNVTLYAMWTSASYYQLQGESNSIVVDPVNKQVKYQTDNNYEVVFNRNIICNEIQLKINTITSGNNNLEFGNFYLVTNNSASTQTLPSATGSGKVVTVAYYGTGTVKVAAQTSQYINGAANQILGQYASVKAIDVAVNNWLILH